MKLPRDIDAKSLIKALRALDYEIQRQRGSHIFLSTKRGGTHSLVVPGHHPIKPGTLNAILRSVCDHHGLSRDEVIHLIQS